MKKYLYAFILSFTFTTLSAQTYKMKIAKKGGEVVEIPADDIEGISFETSGSSQSTTQYVTLFGVKWATGNLQGHMEDSRPSVGLFQTPLRILSKLDRGL